MTLAVIAAAVLGTGLAGCGGEAAQGAPAAARTTAGTAATPAALEHHAAPRTPQTRDGAVEFLYAYIAERDRAFLTNDDGSLVTYTRPSCSCAIMTGKEIARRRAAGLIAVSGEHPRITRIGRWEENGRQSMIGLEIEHPAGDLVDREGKAIRHEGLTIERGLFTLSYEGEQWIIHQLSNYTRPQSR